MRTLWKARPEAPVQVAEERSDSRPVMDGSSSAYQSVAKCPCKSRAESVPNLGTLD
ncbi:MAG: hypothetical protein ACK5LG_22180 [Bacteroides thetaiotaomicron]